MLADLLVPMLIVILLMTAAFRRAAMYDLFVKGAQDGLKTAIQILPNLAAMLCAISLMQSSGFMSAIASAFVPMAKLLDLPREVIPLAALRPVSGSAALAMLERILDQYGPDSRIGLIASTIMGSSETIFYTICIYMSAAGHRKTGYAVPCSLIGALAALWLSGKLF